MLHPAEPPGFLKKNGGGTHFLNIPALFTNPPDRLGTLFNATININKQARIEKFIKEYYAAVWPELEALGVLITHDGFGYRQYNLNRDVDP